MNLAPVVVAISGASGAALGLSVVRQLHAAHVPVELVISAAGERTLRAEIDGYMPEQLTSLVSRVHPADDIGAAIASGSYPVSGMIVAPCSMRSLAAIANSLNETLLIRAADVQLKERRPLVLIARETPLHLGHLGAMTAVTRMGGIIMPPAPAFYLKPQSVDDIVTQIAARAIDLLRLMPPLSQGWQGGA